MARIFLVDGYNVLFHLAPGLPGFPPHSQAARDDLTERLARFCAVTGAEVFLVFDGQGASAQGLTPASFAPGLRLLYTAGGQTADALIERMVFQTKDRAGLVVVTADRSIRNLCGSLGALVMGPAHFLATIMESRERVRHALDESRREVRLPEMSERLDNPAREHMERIRAGLPAHRPVRTQPRRSGRPEIATKPVDPSWKNTLDGFGEPLEGNIDAGMAAELRGLRERLSPPKTTSTPPKPVLSKTRHEKRKPKPGPRVTAPPPMHVSGREGRIKDDPLARELMGLRARLAESEAAIKTAEANAAPVSKQTPKTKKKAKAAKENKPVRLPAPMPKPAVSLSSTPVHIEGTPSGIEQRLDERSRCKLEQLRKKLEK